MQEFTTEIQRINHAAYRCRDAEETRAFYEDLLGMRLSSVLWLEASNTGRTLKGLHIFFEMGDGSFVAFFDMVEGEEPFEYKEKSDFDLHLALHVADEEALLAFKEKLNAAGHEVRGPADHGFLSSLYLRDPNGYVVELTTETEDYDRIMSSHVLEAHDVLEKWQKSKS